MLTTSDPELDRQFRLLRQHGMSVPDTVRHAAKTVVFEEYPVVGFNYRMTDIQAAVGRVQLRRLPGMLAQRVALAERYTERTAGRPRAGPPVRADEGAAELPVVRRAGDAGRTRCTRDELMQALLDARRQHPPRHHERPPGGGLRRPPACVAATLRTCPRRGDPITAVLLHDRARPGPRARPVDRPPQSLPGLLRCEMKQSLILIGISGNTYDILDIVEAINADRPCWEVVGFLDDAVGPQAVHLGLPVLGPVRAAARYVGCAFVNGIGSDGSFWRRPEIVAATGVPAEQFATLVHPAASVSPTRGWAAACTSTMGRRWPAAWSSATTSP